MPQSIFTQIENSFAQLPVADQLRLIERLVHRVNQSGSFVENALDAQLAAMAADPQIQSELRDIDREFACVETDGLEMA